MENQTVLNNLDKNIPNFRSLFTKLDQREKTKFKPILQIVAHSLQFLKKIVTLDESYNFLQKDYKNFVSTTNTTVDMISGSESSKLEMLEKQLSIMQEEWVKLREKEAHAKQRVREMEEEMKQLDEVEEIKKDKIQLSEEFDELKERFDSIVSENNKYKQQISTQSAQLRENEKLIENLNSKIITNADTETKLDELRAKNKKLKKEIEQKDNEIRMQQMEITNIQEALADAQENPVKLADKPAVKLAEPEYKLKYSKLKQEMDVLHPKLEMVQKYKDQIDELWKANKDIRNKYKELGNGWVA